MAHGKLFLTCSIILNGSWVSIHAYNKSYDSGREEHNVDTATYNTVPINVNQSLDSVSDIIEKRDESEVMFPNHVNDLN